MDDDRLLVMLSDCMDHIQEIMGPDGSPEESRELSLAYTKIEEAFLWRSRDLAIKKVMAEHLAEMRGELSDEEQLDIFD